MFLSHNFNVFYFVSQLIALAWIINPTSLLTVSYFQALEKFNIEKDIAAHIKKEFDRKFNPTWHCIVGRNFGSYVTHETKHFIYFYMGQIAILLFKSG